MSDGLDSGVYLAIPYDPERGGPEKTASVVRQLASNPRWFSAAGDEEARLQAAFWVLHHPDHLVWEVWRGEDLVGILLLTRITPNVDALMHFAFFDGHLVGKVGMLRRFLQYCFEDLHFQRLTMEVPDDVPTMVSFARRKLAFRYEGEALDHPLVADIRRLLGQRLPRPLTWISSRGSRKERAHWRDGTLIDLVCLRLTAPEFLGARPGVL